MSEIVTLELPEKVTLRAKEMAARTRRRVEDVLFESCRGTRLATAAQLTAILSHIFSPEIS